MVVEMSCQCGASLVLEGVEDTFAMLLTLRFADSHTSCGYMTPLKTEEPTKSVRHEINFKHKAHTDDED
jgi:hypothetical protein